MSKGAKHIVSIWNSEETAVSDALDIFADKLDPEDFADKWGVQAVKYGEEETEKLDMCAVHWDKCSDESAVLLYREYALDSFITPACGHIHLKSVLYQAARKAMQRPRTKQEITDIPILCAGEKCTANLNQFVFDAGVKDAKLEEIDQIECLDGQFCGDSLILQARDESEGLCQRCHNASGDQMCTGSCILCISCAAIASTTMRGLTCLCNSRYKYEKLAEISHKRGEIIGITAICDAPRCFKCLIQQNMRNYQLIVKTDHGCWLCDSCFSVSNLELTGQWPCCGAVISERDLMKPQVGDQADYDEESTGKCCVLCGKKCMEGDYHYRNFKQHTCQICDNCFTSKIFALEVCPLCSNPASLCGFSDAKLSCKACNTPRKPADFLLFIYFQHSCILCNLCILSNMKACITCFQPFSDKDLEVIYTMGRPDLIEGQRCACGGLMSGGLFSCANECVCSACLLSHMLLTNTRLCPTCNYECAGELPASVHCSRCYRELSTAISAQLNVSGVCVKGHLLCHHCIQITADILTCPLCHTTVQSSKPASELRLEQSKLFLACYCESQESSRMIGASCGHMLHWKCKETLYFCRICGTNILKFLSETAAKAETIWKFVK